jgi:hypothetical protein
MLLLIPCESRSCRGPKNGRHRLRWFEPTTCHAQDQQALTSDSPVDLFSMSRRTNHITENIQGVDIICPGPVDYAVIT